MLMRNSGIGWMQMDGVMHTGALGGRGGEPGPPFTEGSGAGLGLTGVQVDCA